MELPSSSLAQELKRQELVAKNKEKALEVLARVQQQVAARQVASTSTATRSVLCN